MKRGLPDMVSTGVGQSGNCLFLTMRYQTGTKLCVANIRIESSINILIAPAQINEHMCFLDKQWLKCFTNINLNVSKYCLVSRMPLN